MAPDFTVVLRGFDREEVDALLAEFAAGALAPEDLTRVHFTVVLRGYDRDQVQQYLTLLAAGPAPQRPDPGPAQRQPVFGKAPFLVKGYDRAQVDALVARVAPVLAGGGGITADEIENAVFGAARSGYDCEQVDRGLDAVVHELRGRA
ncbi:DivIVA domain-containing protein [Catellatospora sp. KI3]|uniref:DivIVA domain-containing protein n=1 Tax=Catellatospora sp. KI3 TaxID=3041620 RepID=UPI0024828C5A|nr:DivIVA domain-containing protein [Catellatospora sp. KI3]MDI1466301.1 DivIVA domain-containing protein [Catellatospora sp. KI3]